MTEKIELKVGNHPKNKAENGLISATPENLPFLKVEIYQLFFLFLWLKRTKMKVRPYFAMQKVQKLLKTPSYS